MGRQPAKGTAGSKRKSSRRPALPRVVVVDDHPVYRQGLADTIEQCPDVELAGEAGNGLEALDVIRRLKPDVAVLDVKLPELDGIEVMNVLAAEGVPSRILFLSAYLDCETVFRAVESGARGYVSKDSPGSTICDAVVAVAAGQMALSPETQEAIAEKISVRTTADGSSLSEREQEIISLMANGLSVAEIARRLYLSPFTVKTHIKHAYRKLEVSDRGAAVAKALRTGLVK